MCLDKVLVYFQSFISLPQSFISLSFSFSLSIFLSFFLSLCLSLSVSLYLSFSPSLFSPSLYAHFTLIGNSGPHMYVGGHFVVVVGF